MLLQRVCLLSIAQAFAVVQAQNSCSGVYSIFSVLSGDAVANSFCSSKFSIAPATSTVTQSISTTVTATATATATATITATTTSVTTTTSTITSTTTQTSTTAVNYVSKRKRGAIDTKSSTSKSVCTSKSKDHTTTTTTDITTTTTNPPSTTTTTTGSPSTTTKPPSTTTTKSSSAATTTTKTITPNLLSTILSAEASVASNACNCITTRRTLTTISTITSTATTTTTTTASVSTTVTDTVTSTTTSVTTTVTTTTTTVTSSCPSASPSYCVGTGCVNPQNDVNNCGSCGNVCPEQSSTEDDICLNGQCSPPMQCGNTVTYCGPDPNSLQCACDTDTNGKLVCAQTDTSLNGNCNSDADCNGGACIAQGNTEPGYKGGCTSAAAYKNCQVSGSSRRSLSLARSPLLDVAGFGEMQKK